MNVSATLRGVAIGLALGAVLSFFVVLFERDAFIPYSAVVMVCITGGVLLGAAVLSISGRHRALAKSLLVAGVVLFAFFYTVVGLVRS